MAIYYTLGVDCGADRELAERISLHFDSFSIAIPGGAPVICKSHVETQRGIHFVCVYPRGMGHATLPESERRPELANEPNVSHARGVLYAELATCLGFRRAMFGAECCDQMAFATHEEDADIDYCHMISSEAVFPHPPDDRPCEPFAEGYRIAK